MKEGKAYIGDEIVEGNEVIALFMGAEWCEDDYGEWGYKGNFPGPFQYRAKNNLKYHSSWDWLMPVVDKIEADNFQFNIFNESCEILAIEQSDPHYDFKRNFRTINVDGEIKIKSVWDAAIRFITWYNNQNKQS